MKFGCALPLVPVAVALLAVSSFARAAEPGLPFTEDFTDTNLMDAEKTNATWDTDQGAIFLGSKQRRFGVFSSELTSEVDISSDSDGTESIALGDVDGDGDLDLVAGNWPGPNRLYLNNGTANPWEGVSGIDITSDSDNTASIALGDVE